MITFKRTVTGLATLLALGTLSTTARAAETTFARTFDPGGTGGSPAAFTTDAAGNTVVVGTVYEAGAPFTQGLEKHFQTIKYDHNGAIVWKRSYAKERSNNDNLPTAVCTDAVGNVFVAGTQELNPYGGDYLVVKYNPAGVLLWTRHAFGTEPYGRNGLPYVNTTVIPVAIKSDNAGSVYMVGHSATFTEPGGYTIGGHWDIIKLSDTTGYSVWNRSLSGTGIVTPYTFNNQPTDIAIDTVGNIAVCGTVYDTHPGVNSYDLAAVEYSPSGAVRWKHITRQDGCNTFSSRLGVDASNNVYVAGGFNPGTGGSFSPTVTLSYSSMGAFRWKQLHDAYAVSVQIAGLTVNAKGNIVVGAGEDYSGGYGWQFLRYASSGMALPSPSVGTSSALDGFVMDSQSNIIATGVGHDDSGRKNDFLTLSLPVTGGYFNWLHYYRGPATGYGSPLGVQVDASDNIYVVGSTALYVAGQPYIGWALVKYLP